MTPGKRLILDQREGMAKLEGGEKWTDGWPIQARFWLEWGCLHVTDMIRLTN
jgi:hypothetical protein